MAKTVEIEPATQRFQGNANIMSALNWFTDDNPSPGTDAPPQQFPEIPTTTATSMSAAAAGVFGKRSGQSSPAGQKTSSGGNGGKTTGLLKRLSKFGLSA